MADAMAMLPTPSLWREPRNAALDSVFYDVGALSDVETAQLSRSSRAEGMVLEVGPSFAPSLRVWESVHACEDLAPHYPAITIAGVGSSAVGAAALGRNAADAFGEKVLAVVSGYGMADLAYEAMGGFFLFGGLNAIRHSIQSIEAVLPTTFLGSPFAFPTLDPGQPFHIARNSEDVRALVALLSGKVSTDWLVGHSKGNLVISEALYALRDKAPDHFAKAAEDLDIVTFGARIAMPTEMGRVIDVMGALDGFGALNSRPDIATDVLIAESWHHTNTRLPLHMPVTGVLERILKERA